MFYTDLQNLLCIALQGEQVIPVIEKWTFLIRQSHPGFWKVEMEMGTGRGMVERWK